MKYFLILIISFIQVLFAQEIQNVSAEYYSARNFESGVEATPLNVHPNTQSTKGFSNDSALKNKNSSNPSTDKPIANTFSDHCTDSIIIQPGDVWIPNGTASFLVLSSSSSPTYQWQQRVGNTFVNIGNSGYFFGANSITLNVVGVSFLLNGLQVRCIVDHGGCIDTSNTATLHSCFELTTQPIDQYVVLGNTAIFSTSSNGGGSFQWQTKVGGAFQNLTNSGQFAGVQSDILHVNGVTQANHNQEFRCVVSGGTCLETTISAKIIISGVGVSENELMHATVSPTPTPGLVDLGFTLEGTYSLIGIDGRTVQSGSLRQILDFSNQPAGVYTLRLETSAGNRVVKVVKE